MIDFPRVVICYHGCLEPFAGDLLSGTLGIDDWQESAKPYDWLGRGIYFWEHAPHRAWEWATQKAQRTGDPPAMIGAVIQLDRCFDLTDSIFTDDLAAAYPTIVSAYAAVGRQLPENRGKDSDLRNRLRDCIVINEYLDGIRKFAAFSSVRAAFPEGGAAFEGAMITKRSHIQVVVRDRSCIKGVFRPTLKG